jgi:hypothetical protein
MAYAFHLLDHRQMHDPIVTPIALGVGAAASAASTGYTIYNTNKQADAAEDASDAQANEQKRLRDELAEKQLQEEASTAARDARTRQRLAGGMGGRKSMTFTSPLGLPELGGYKGGTFLSGGGR